MGGGAFIYSFYFFLLLYYNKYNYNIMTDDELLNHLYHVKKNYGGAKQLYDKAKIQHPKITFKIVDKWLKDQASYQLNKEDVKQKQFLPIYSDIPNNYQIDLTFFPRYKKENKGYWVLFTAININTRYSYAYYGKDKEKQTILDMLKLMHGKTEINAITCDEGKEFNNKIFLEYCDKNDIVIYFVKDDSHKLGIINRFHRTIKDKLKYYFSDDDTLNWVSVIDDIIKNYNETVNRGIGYKPKDVTAAIENDIINKKKAQTGEVSEKVFPEFKIGDKVRILRKEKLFEDKLMTKYHDMIFTVIKVYNNSLDVVAEDGREFHPKKSYCKIINNVVVHEVEKPVKNINEKLINIGKINKQEKLNKKLDNNVENIREYKRERKPNQFFV